jgi:hypothetical protein
MLRVSRMPHDLVEIKKMMELAWQLRTEQQVGLCREQLGKILSVLGIQIQDLSERLLLQCAASQQAVLADVTLLAASLARSEGKLDESKRMIAFVESALSTLSLPAPFQLHFQKGNTNLIEGDYSEGLNHFLLAVRTASSLMEKICAQSNIIYCLENMGLPFDSALKELELLFGKADSRDFIDLRTQYSAMKMRLHFRRGELTSVFESSESLPGQAMHFRSWIAELPYHKFYGFLSEGEREVYLTQNPHFFQKAYRLRTLQGILHPADAKPVRASDLCDRLYLWTWRWLTNPESFTLEKVLALLKDVDFPALAPRLTLEDCQLLRNALLWVSLFAPSRASSLRRLAQSLVPKSKAVYPLFDFETHLLEYLSAVQQSPSKGRPLFAQLKKHALWGSQEVFLSQLALLAAGEVGSVAEPLSLLGKRLSQICVSQHKLEQGKLYVDLVTFRLQWNEGKDWVLSEPMCLALDLLYRRECVESSEFVEVCFGLPHFDSFIHNAKIYNLLARVKRSLPKSLHIKTKNGRIYAIGEWDSVVFQRPAGCGEVVERQNEWKHLAHAQQPTKNMARPVKPAVLVAGTDGKKLLTRKELESLTGKSKSSASRLISSWIDQGLVRRVGQAKNTKYLLVSLDNIDAAAL